jgi:short-subunit dehydrogenase
MPKSIVIVGAGRGLGRAVARRYGPEGYMPVTELTAKDLRELMPIALYALVDIVHAFLPAMVRRGSGAVLAAAAPSAVAGMPQLSATAGLAAQRNYLQSLQAAASQQGIYVGRLYIGATIEHSAFHVAQEAAKAAGQPVIDLPIVSPDHLADLLWNMQHHGDAHELIYPVPG